MEQPNKRSRDRPRRSIIGSQSSGGSSNTLPFDEGTEGIPELAKPSTHGRRSSVFDWVCAITQAMVAAVGPSSNSHAGRLEAAQMMETVRRLRAQEFRGTINPIEVEKWLKNLERTFRVMDYPKERKVSIASFLLRG